MTTQRFQDPTVWLHARELDLPAMTREEQREAEAAQEPERYRTIWISDLHLGMPETRVHLLHDFLKHTESDYLYLVGDIVDLWKLKNGWHWPAVNNSIIRRITKKAKHGTQVVYIPGNHDEALREYLGMSFGDNITLQAHAFHRGADGRRYLILHGDEFDTIVMNNRLLSVVGGEAYALSLKLNRWFNVCRRLLGFPYWSLSAFLKQRVKNAMSYICNFEQAVVHEAREAGVDVVVCGHIHHAAIREIDGITYCNDGDWVESCTALVEHFDGSLELIDWTKRQIPATPDTPTPAAQEAPPHAHRDHQRRLVATG